MTGIIKAMILDVLLIPSDAKFVKFYLVLFGIAEVSTDITRYPLVLPGIAQSEEKKTLTQIVLSINFFTYYHVVSHKIVMYLLGTIQ